MTAGPSLLAEVCDAYSRLVEEGWTDALWALHPGERIYTFWKYFRNAFARDAGLRIDHLLLSPPLAKRLTAALASIVRCECATTRATMRIELVEATSASPGRGRRPKTESLR